MTQVLISQEAKHTELIGHAQQKFQDLESRQQSLVDAAATKFSELDSLRTNFELQVASKVSELDQKMVEVTRVYTLISGVAETDAAAARAKLAQSFSGKAGVHKEISEYKAVTALGHFTGDCRVSYKAWTRKLKNCLEQVRGKSWRLALDDLETHRISSDFEELTTLDVQWDEWFRAKHGANRSDGNQPVDLDQFKTELNWILTDKLPENLLELIRKHEQNGLRSYKKLYIWSVDISSEAKQQSMNKIMNPPPAASEEVLADAIEKWDRDQVELLKVDPSCELPTAFKLPAFKNLFPPAVLNHVQNQMDSTVSDNYLEVRKRVYAWALRKRLQTQSAGSGNGGVNQVDLPDELTPVQAQSYAPWSGQPWGGGDTGGSWGLDNVGKGKGAYKGWGTKGGGKVGGKASPKGGKGCWTCGGPHFAAECPNAKGGGKAGSKGYSPWGKGAGYPGAKGKGKGLNELDQPQAPPVAACAPCGDNAFNQIDQGFQGYCFNCGAWGHSARFCPQPPKGGGKGIASVEFAQVAPEVPPPQQAAQTSATGAGGSFGSLDLGGEESKDPGPEVRTLKEICEAAGWRVNASGQKKNRFCPPNLDVVLELCAVDEAVNQLAPGIAELAKQVRDGQISEPNCAGLPPGHVWQELKVTMDSGACDHVLNPKDVDASEVNITDAVRRGVTYSCAGGLSLPNLGEVRIDGMTGEGQELNLTMQLAGVKKPLASVRKMCKAGNRVVFDEI